MNIFIRLLIMVCSFSVASVFASSFDATVERIGIDRTSHSLVVAVDNRHINSAALEQSNQLSWSLEDEATDAILSTLLSAYHAQSTVEFHYTPGIDSQTGAHKGDSVFIKSSY